MVPIYTLIPILSKFNLQIEIKGILRVFIHIKIMKRRELLI